VDSDVVDRQAGRVVTGVGVEQHQVAGLEQSRGGRGGPGGAVDEHARSVVGDVP
jgi:hypothetical protein